MVATSTLSQSRYARGIKNPDPIKMDVLRVLLERDPSISKADLARKAGLSRAGVTYYIRSMREEMARATAKSEELRRRAAENDVDLSLLVKSLALRMGREVEGLLSKYPPAKLGALDVGAPRRGSR